MVQKSCLNAQCVAVLSRNSAASSGGTKARQLFFARVFFHRTNGMDDVLLLLLNPLLLGEEKKNVFGNKIGKLLHQKLALGVKNCTLFRG